MGCGSSQPLDGAAEGGGNQARGGAQVTKELAAPVKPAQSAAVGSENSSKNAAGDGSSQKSATTRARRLSYIIADQNGQNGQAQPEGAQAPAASKATHNSNGVVNSTSTRARRLSHVIQEPGADGKVPEAALAAADGDAEDRGSAGTPNPIKAGTADLPDASAADSKGRSLRIAVACMSRAGREPGFKKTNQDNCFAFEKYITEDQSLFGAMDGHGPHGHLVSGFVKQHLPIILVNHLTSDKDPRSALSSGFLEVNRSLSASRIDCEFSGTTAVVTYLKGRTLTTAWVGDSRGVLGRRGATGWEAVDLTVDHKPTTPEEKARILRCNGRVERLVDETGQPMGPHRVWLQYAWIPGLAMSRALGDVLAHQVGVVSEPDHTVVDVTPADGFMILASDGVWEFISSQEAVDIVAGCDAVEDACRQLVDEAYQRWLTEEEGVVDDITAVVVKFLHPQRA